jgi:hypothetical protein
LLRIRKGVAAGFAGKIELFAKQWLIVVQPEVAATG